MPSGSSSALANAIIFWQLPQGIFATSVTTVLFPRMSREAGRQDTDALRATLGYGMRSIVALLLPASILLALFGSEVIAVAFQRGAFTAADTVRTAHVLVYYCVGMVGVSVYGFLQRYCYAGGDYRTPTYTAIGVLVVNFGLSLWLKETALQAGGLALANAIAFTLAAVVLAAIAWVRLHGIAARRLAVTTLKAIGATAPGVAVLIAGRRLFGPWWVDGSSLRSVGLLLAIGVPTLAVTIAGFVVLRIEAAAIITRRFNRDKT
ncbi:MAG: hypothetical protein EA382_06620 [Spirochaetaceae bacterium]|nr:MAG: hypothetical protein EA382_06620 [Spirochaetaceae bacterium]